jgi:hypothetical protein
MPSEHHSSQNTTTTTTEGNSANAKRLKMGVRQETAVFDNVPKSNQDQRPFEVPNNIQLNEDEIKSSYEVTIRNLGSDDLLDKELKFNALGLIDAGRDPRKKNGLIYFSNKDTKNLKLDYKLNTNYFPLLSNPDVKKSANYFYLFVLYYIKTSNSYRINFHQISQYLIKDNQIDKELYKDYKMFIQVSNTNPHKIIARQIIRVGDDTYLEIFCENTENKLHIRDLSNIMNEKIFRCEQKTVTIGNDISCSFVIENKQHIANIHCTLTYSNVLNGWMLKDGDDDKGSETGSWALAMHEIDLYDGLVLEIDKKQIVFSFN